MEKIGETRVRYQQIFEQLDANMKKTKIVCTLGVQSSEKEMLVKMIDGGMNIARLNFSDGDHKSHGETLESLQAALEERPEKTCSVMLDT
jgi:pyruvate kinase